MVDQIEKIKIQAKIMTLEKFFFYKHGNKKEDIDFIKTTFEDCYNELIQKAGFQDSLKTCRSKDRENRELYIFVQINEHNLWKVFNLTNDKIDILDNGNYFLKKVGKHFKHGDYILKSIRTSHIKIIDGGLFDEYFEQFN
jgi:hypothetical protein